MEMFDEAKQISFPPFGFMHSGVVVFLWFLLSLFRFCLNDKSFLGRMRCGEKHRKILIKTTIKEV